MFKKLFNRGEAGEEKKNINFIKGISLGIGAALIVLIIILLAVFGGKIKDKITGNDTAGTNNNADVPTADAPKLRLTVITSDKCGTDCFNIDLFLQALRQNNINETGFETIRAEDQAGQDLINQYKITKVPTVLIAGELDKNPQLAQAWPALGEVIDGVFVFRELIPPYLDLASDQIKGKMSVTFITDNSCAECYDVKLHETALQNLGLSSNDSKTIDVGSDEGRALIEKYKLTAAPTILLNGDLGAYKNLKQVWESVGVIADDGTYVFTTGVKEMGSYTDLATGKFVEVKLPEPTAPQTVPATE